VPLNNNKLEQIEDRLEVLDNMKECLNRVRNEAPIGKYKDVYFTNVIDYIDIALSLINCDIVELEEQKNYVYQEVV